VLVLQGLCEQWGVIACRTSSHELIMGCHLAITPMVWKLPEASLSPLSPLYTIIASPCCVLAEDRILWLVPVMPAPACRSR